MSIVPIKAAIPLEIPRVEIVDVGAMLEGVERYASLVAQGLARVTGFEPDPAQHAKLTAARTGETYQYLPVFLGNGGPAMFHVTEYPGCSSLYKPDPKVIDMFTSIDASRDGGNFRVVRTVQVETRRLDDVAACPPPDLLKLDVQGAELDVLRNGTRALASALVIESEVEFVAMYQRQPLFGDVQVFLREHGFVLHKLIDIAGRSFRPWKRGGNRFAPLSQLLWADAVFVRDFIDLSSWSDAQLIKGVAIVHEVYQSVDLAHTLLAELGRRRNVDFLTGYVAAVKSAEFEPLYMNLKLHD